MTNKLRGMPGPAAHVFCILWTLLLTAVLLVTALAFPAVRLMTDRDWNVKLAKDSAVVDAQYAAIGETVDALAEKYSFEPNTVMDLVTRESIEAYAEKLVDWRLALLTADADYTVPAYQVEGLTDAIKADETFQAATDKNRRTSVARDTITVKVQRTVEETVAPLRLSLIALALGKALPVLNLSRFTPYLPYAPYMLLGVSLLLAGLIALTAHKRLVKAALYIGSACTASGLLLAAVGVLLALANVPQLVGAYSAMAGMQVETLLRALAWGYVVQCGVLLIVGLLLIGVHQRGMQPLYRAAEQAA